jgi:pyruvate/2-oxoglutarate/acetoin dehydrogenase E1 component
MKFVASINYALDRLLLENKNVVFYGEDLADPYGGAFKVSKGLSTKYPGRVLSTPISEAAIIGVAGGMAVGGLKPIVEIMFGDFLMLGADQLLNHLVKYEGMYNGKVKSPVTIRATMGGRRGYGPTHSQSLEAILASIPQLKIFSPTHYHNPGELLEHVVLNESGAKVFCEYKMNYPRELVGKDNTKEGLSLEYSSGFPKTVYLSNAEFGNPDLLIISHGGNSILVEDLMHTLLMEYELGVQANFPAIIKPLNCKDLFYGVDKCSNILIIEESVKSFGWGAEIVASMHELGMTDGKKIMRFGAEEVPIPSSALLEEKVLPSQQSIIGYLKDTGII